MTMTVRNMICIVIQQKNFLRHISCDEKIFIEDQGLKNWVYYNGVLFKKINTVNIMYMFNYKDKRLPTL